MENRKLTIISVPETDEQTIERLREQCRSLNRENRELRKQLGQKVSYEDIRECIKNISWKLMRWFSDSPLSGYLSDIKISKFGELSAEMRFRIGDGIFVKDKDTEEVINAAKDYGFDLHEKALMSHSSGDWHILATQKNFDLVMEMCKAIKGHPHDFIVDTLDGELIIESATLCLNEFSALEEIEVPKD